MVYQEINVPQAVVYHMLWSMYCTHTDLMGWQYYGRGQGRGRIVIANLASERSYGRTKKRFDYQIKVFS